MSCTKVRYPTEYAARRACEAIRRRGTTRRPLYGIHPCAVCHAWHITSSRRVPKKWRVR